MKEILGANLDKAFVELGIEAKKTYQAKKLHHDFQEEYQVWELSDEDFTRLDNVSNDEWNDDWGWWRWSNGSNLGSVGQRYNINGHYIVAWDGCRREDNEEENKTLPPDGRWTMPRKYSHLTEYFCEEIGASTEKNVTALAIDLARQNGIKLCELFEKYQG